jgi:hypothetical protein
MNKDTENKVHRYLGSYARFSGICPAPNDFIKGAADIAMIVRELLDTKAGSPRHATALSRLAALARHLDTL